MQSIRIFFIFFVLILLVGFSVWALAAAGKDEMRQAPIQSLSSSQVNLTLHKLFSEHGTLATTHLNNLYDGRDTIDTEEQLELNTQKLADIFESLGNQADRSLFIKTFQGHIKEYESYTEGLKTRDQEKMTTAKQMLDAHGTDFSKLTHRILPAISEERAKELMDQHVLLTLEVVNAHAASDSAREFNALKDASIQANHFADQLGKAIDAKKKQ